MAFIRYFTAVPRIVLNDPSCSSTDKLVMGVINSLSNNKEYCYASNDYFSKELNVGTKTISNSLSKLKKLGFIYIEYVKKERHIYMNPKIVMEENSKVSEKNLPVMVEENYQQKRKNYKKKNYNINNTNFKNCEPTISYDSDGVMLWNGKRCESKECTPEEMKEMEELLSEFY